MREKFNFQHLDFPVDLTVHTKSPSKWLLIDRETGQVFQGNTRGSWDRLEPIIREMDND